jgi:hypothetical protein
MFGRHGVTPQQIKVHQKSNGLALVVLFCNPRSGLEDCEFQVSLSYTVRPTLKKPRAGDVA